MSPDSKHLFLCDAERKDALRDELRIASGGGEADGLAGDGALSLDGSAIDRTGSPLNLAFARQTLPAARSFSGYSISEIARAAAQAAIENCDELQSWDLHVYRSTDSTAPGPNRVRVVLAEIQSELKKRRRRLLRTLKDQSAPQIPQAIVQLYLESRERCWLSAFVPERDSVFRRCVSPFPGGEWTAPEDRRPPSRAYRKLAEALVQFPWLNRSSPAAAFAIQAGERCVDLGASPGGWSWLALEYGAAVVAVDRSPLRADLMQHPRLRFVQGDAFQYRPTADSFESGNYSESKFAVDWLICDVIAFPDRILELLSDWLRNRRCEKFCVTVKFRGSEDYAALETIKNMLHERAFDFAIRRLCENKNEATIFGTL